MRIGTRMGIGLLAGLAVVAALGVAGYLSTKRLIATNLQVERRVEVIADLGRTMSDLKDAETGQRGYLLTGEEEYLEPYDAALRELPADMDRVAERVRDDPAQAQRLQQVRELVRTRLEVIDETIRLRRQGEREAALAVVASGRGKKLMEDIRALIGQMEGREEQLLTARRAEAMLSVRRTTWSTLIGVPLLLLALVIAGTRFTRSITRPLASISRAADSISMGELTMLEARKTGLNEIDSLQASFARMTTWLRGISDAARRVAAGDYRTGIAPASDRDELGQSLAVMVSNLLALSENLRKRTEELEQLLAALPAYVWICSDTECLHITGNRAVNELIGVPAGTNVSQSVAATGEGVYVRQLKPDGTEYQLDELPMERAIALGRPIRDVEIDMRLADGRQARLLGGAVPLFDAAGAVRGAVAAFTDITDRKRAEEALRASQRDYATLFEESVVGQAQADAATGRFIRVNPALAQMTGYSVDELLAMTATELTHPEDRARDAQTVAPARAGQADRWQIEKRYVRKDGSAIWVSVAGTAVRYSDGRPAVAIAVIQDVTARVLAQEALRASESRYRTLFETMTEGFALCEIVRDESGRPYDLRYIAINPAFEHQTGIREADVVGHTLLEVFPGAEAVWIERFGEVALTGEATRFEGRFGPLGRWFEVSAYRTEPGRFAVVFHDTTERNLADRAVRESEERLRFAMETIHAGVWDLDLSDRTAFRSLEHDRIFGYAELLPQWTYEMFLEHVLPEDRATVDGKFRQALESKGGWNFECRIRRADGQVRWIMAAGRYTQNASGNAARMAGIVQDITAHKAAEEAVRQSEERFRTMANALPQLAWVAQADGYILWYNQRWYDYTGKTAQEMEGWGWQSVQDPETLPRVLEHWKASIATGEPIDMEFPLRRADGVFHPFLTRAMPVKDAGGRVTLWVGTSTDITERKQAEEELERTNRMLRMLGSSTEAVIRIDNEQELMQEICRLAVEVGGYRMAWVGMAQDDENKSVLPAASAGFEAGYLEDARITWADEPRGSGPTGCAIRTGEVQIVADALTDPRLDLWREDALRRGYRSSIALPLREDHGVVGALSIYGAEPAAFGKGQAHVLLELAEDLALGLAARRMRTALRENRDRLRALAGELTLAEQSERERLAALLHDHLQQLLVAAKYHAAILGSVEGEEVRTGVAEVVALLDESIKASRSLTAELSPPVLHEGGLREGLEWLAHWTADKHGMHVDVSVHGDISPAAKDVKVLLFEAVRELLFNAVKHSGAKAASVSATRLEGDLVRIIVSDQGRGFDPEKVTPAGSPGGGFGLFSVGERLSFVGGRMEIDSAPGKGSRVAITAPIGGPPEAATPGDGSA